MATIIAGRVDQQDRVQDAVSQLERAGFAHDRISSFYVNPPGQHDLLVSGGDRDRSPGTEDSNRGMAAGSAAGAAAGIAATPVMGPGGPIAGSLVGAYVGSLVGSLSQMSEAEETPPIRRSGMWVAVETADEADQTRAIDALGAVGAVDIERAEGAITDGEWNDFDPLSTPMFVEQSERRA